MAGGEQIQWRHGGVRSDWYLNPPSRCRNTCLDHKTEQRSELTDTPLEFASRVLATTPLADGCR